MKLKNRINKMTKKASSEKYGRHIYGSVFALFIFMAVGLQSCANINEKEPAQPATPSGDYAEITLTLPFVGFGDNLSTRDDEIKRDPIDTEDDEVKRDPIDTDYGEGGLKTLYVVIFKENVDYSGQYDFHSLIDVSQLEPIDGKLDSSYSTNFHTFKLEEGSYKFYVVGNILDYWLNGQTRGKTQSDFETLLQVENNIRRMKLAYDEALISPDNLPMICWPENVCTYDTNGDSPVYKPLPDGILTITKEDIKNFQENNQNNRISIYAPLSILCTKVRYTVLFDNTKNPEDGFDNFSKAFPFADINFTPIDQTSGKGKIEGAVKFENLFKYFDAVPLTNISSSTPTDWISEKTLNISQVEYPQILTSGNDGKGTYFDIANAEKSPDRLVKLTTEEGWNPATRRAWQGIAYLPENNPNYTKDSETKTQLILSASGSGVKSSYLISLDKLERGHFYDLVVKLKTSDLYTIELNVKVIPWIYNSYEFNKDHGW